MCIHWVWEPLGSGSMLPELLLLLNVITTYYQESFLKTARELHNHHWSLSGWMILDLDKNSSWYIPFCDNLWGIEIGNLLSGKGLILVGNPGDMDSGESNPPCSMYCDCYPLWGALSTWTAVGQSNPSCPMYCNHTLSEDIHSPCFELFKRKL